MAISTFFFYILRELHTFLSVQQHVTLYMTSQKLSVKQSTSYYLSGEIQIGLVESQVCDLADRSLNNKTCSAHSDFWSLQFLLDQVIQT